MSSTLKRLAVEGRLARNAWRILVYLIEHHRAGIPASNLEALQISPQTLTAQVGHLIHRGLAEDAPGGGWRLGPGLRKELALDVSIKPEADPGHPFLARDRETQRRALASWYNTGKRRDLVAPLAYLWRSGNLAGADRAALDRAEQAAAALPPAEPAESETL